MLRARGFSSWGDNPDFTYFGGNAELRGYDYLSFAGLGGASFDGVPFKFFSSSDSIERPVVGLNSDLSPILGNQNRSCFVLLLSTPALSRVALFAISQRVAALMCRWACSCSIAARAEGGEPRPDAARLQIFRTASARRTASSAAPGSPTAGGSAGPAGAAAG